MALHHDTRLLGPTDTPDAAETLALAFQDEAAWRYIMPDARQRAARLPAAFHLLLREEFKKGAVFATTEIEAVTMWRGPGQAHDSLWDRARMLIPFAQVLRGSLLRALEVSDLIERHLPKEPCWYLHFAGCHPSFKGFGFGGAAIRAGLAKAEDSGLPAYLETADEGNVALYQNFGFSVKHVWQIPEGPMFWGMQRPGKTRH
jgi:GNAT superfamily N-acetyltransferase